MEDLKTYYFALNAEGREAFVRACGVTRGHMQNVAYGYRAVSAELAAAIERESRGTVTRRKLRPKDWQAIWPELAESMARAGA